MHLADLASTSAAAAQTSSRLEKRALLAEALRAAAPAEVGLVATYLSGSLRQRCTGVGWRSLATLPPPATTPDVPLVQIDDQLQHLSELSGAGSAGARKKALDSLFASLTSAEQEFLAALITGNLRQGAQDSLMLDAIAQAFDLPVKAVRRAAMFSAPTGPIATAAATGGEPALAEFTMQVHRPVRPMLASSAPDVAAALDKLGHTSYLVDTKLDGIRIQVHKDDEGVSVFTRSLDEIGDRLPGVVAAVRDLEGDLILDGEALLVDEGGRARPFQETASNTASHGPAEVVRPFFFDILHDGETLIEKPMHERIARLDRVLPEQLRVQRVSSADDQPAAEFFAEVVASGQEGIVVKSADAGYEAGRRGAAWIKVKPRHTLDLVVLAVEWGSGRRTGKLSNIHLGARSADGFTMLGKTFKGMTDAMLEWQTQRFSELMIDDDGWVVRVRPEQVVEIAFDGVQRSRRYPGGVALRFARVLRYRDDKSANEADTLESVQAMLDM